jgi:hypothetical protein
MILLADQSVNAAEEERLQKERAAARRKIPEGTVATIADVLNREEWQKKKEDCTFGDASESAR